MDIASFNKSIGDKMRGVNTIVPFGNIENVSMDINPNST
jgi:hypothetical protein